MEERFEQEFGGTVPNTGLYSFDQIDETANVKSFVSSELSSLARALLEKQKMYYYEIDDDKYQLHQAVQIEDIEAVCGERGIIISSDQKS